eukprot:GFUD01079575.1.p1 GENE.GFUD01079575.1~~GFUD01079575.1.p1  ORF type:complete len:112 (-),score=21.08 GFUD01079575.1:16-351(-)
MQNAKVESDLFICQNNIGLIAKITSAIFIIAALLIVTAFAVKNKSVSVVTSEIQPLLDHPDPPITAQEKMQLAEKDSAEVESTTSRKVLRRERKPANLSYFLGSESDDSDF